MSFNELALHAQLNRAIEAAGYTTPTPVQAQAIPVALSGKDALVSSNTGSGKTAAYVLPALHKILSSKSTATKPGPRVLVLAPTRELVLQVAKAVEEFGRGIKGLKTTSVVGGVPYGLQLRMLRGSLDVLIATPGRLLDHLRAGKVNLSTVETLILDEADRMLDMGFIEDIETIAAATPAARQTLMLSATFAGHVGKLAERMTKDPVKIMIDTHTERHVNIEQRLQWADDISHKNAMLDHVLTGVDVVQALVFTSTQRDADKLAMRLEDAGHAVAALHGGMPQGRRNRTLLNLRTGRLRVLVATDVAARGIDVPSISHVINYGLPITEEDYVHRIGRTGRAGRSGLAITLAAVEDAGKIRRIERFTTQKIPVVEVVGLEPKRRPGSHVPGKPGVRPPARGGFGHRKGAGFGAKGGAGTGGGFGGGGRDGARDGARGGWRTGGDRKDGARTYSAHNAGK